MIDEERRLLRDRVRGNCVSRPDDFPDLWSTPGHSDQREQRRRQTPPAGGFLSDQLGTYLTIEGVKTEGGKIETGTFLVDTVNGKKLDKPISLLIRGLPLSTKTFNRRASTCRRSGAASSRDLRTGK